MCFGVTEPGAGLDTSRITTFAKRDGDTYRVNGRKVWISKALESEKILLLTRTTPYDEVTKKTDGMTLFLTDLDRDHVDIRPIKKMGRNAVSSNEVFIDDLHRPVEDRVGEEGKGFQYILDGLNPERMLIAAEALGIGRVALEKAVKYGNERVVFDRPIGMNQGLQFPLADSLARLDAAELVLRKATWLYDNGKPCGREANTAKYLCADAGFDAADRALQTHGGMGYSEEYHVSRYFRESRLMKIAPGQPGDDPELPGRTRARLAEELLMDQLLRPDRPLGAGDRRGAGGGIGAAVAEALADAGAAVLVTDMTMRRGRGCGRTHFAPTAAGPTRARSTCVTAAPPMRPPRRQRRSADGALHILVNNAGVTSPAMFAEADATRSFRLTVRHPRDGHVPRAPRPRCRYIPTDGTGRIINVTSAAGLTGTLGRSTTRPPRPASSASPNRWPASWPPRTSWSTPWRRLRRRR